MKSYFVVFLSCHLMDTLISALPASISSSPSTLTKSIEESTEISPDILKPDLNCFLFDDAGCQISCNVMCDVYGCQSSGNCIDQLYCNCHEILEISSSSVTIDDYHNLSLDKLWYSKFEKSSVSDKILNRIESNPEIAKDILTMLKNPHSTGDNIKNELLKSHSQWSRVRDLEPKHQGHIHDFTENDDFNYDNFNQYLEDKLNPLLDEAADRLKKIRYRKRIAELLNNIGDNELQYIIKQIFSSGNSSLLNYVRNYLQTNGYDVDDIFNPVDGVEKSLDKDDIDLFINNSVANRLIDYKDNLNSETIRETQPLAAVDENVLTEEVNKFPSNSRTSASADNLYDYDFHKEITRKPRARKSQPTKKSRSQDRDFPTQITKKPRAGKSQFVEESMSDNLFSVEADYEYYDDTFDVAQIDEDYETMSYEVYPNYPSRITNVDNNNNGGNYAYSAPVSYDTLDEDYESTFQSSVMNVNNNNNGGNYVYSAPPLIYGYYGREEQNGYYGNDGYWGNNNGGYAKNWNLGNSGITVAGDRYGNNIQSWDLGKSGVTVGSDAGGNTGMQWKLGKSSITVMNDGNDYWDYDDWSPREETPSLWNLIKRSYRKLF